MSIGIGSAQRSSYPMFFTAIVALSPNSLRRFCTAALRISPMFTSAMRMLPCVSRSTSSKPARSAGSIPSANPSATTATPSSRPYDSRLMIAPTSVSTTDLSRMRRSRNSSGMSVIVARRLEPERVHLRRQVEIVVDGLGHVHDLEPPRRPLLELHGRIRRVVTADGNELRDVEAQQRQHGVVEMRRVLGGVGARDPDVGPAAKMDPAHLADVERGHVVDVALHDPLEPVAHPEHVDRLQPCSDDGRTNNTVDARRWPAPHQDGERFPLGHRLATGLLRTPRAACATPAPLPAPQRC